MAVTYLDAPFIICATDESIAEFDASVELEVFIFSPWLL